MKKIFYLVSLLFFIFSCTEDDILVSDAEDKSEAAGYSMTGGSGISGGRTGGVGDGVGGGQDTTGIIPGQITAGEWNDLENWDFWADVINGQDYSQMPGYWDYDLTGRISVHIKNAAGQPAVDVEVTLQNFAGDILWKTRTDNTGNAELWPGHTSDQSSVNELKIIAEGHEYSNVKTIDEGVNELIISPVQSLQEEADIAFMVDATGSMGDELEYLKTELMDVIDEVQNENQRVVLKTGAVFYRDEGDEYITRKSDFSSDKNITINFIKNQSASGGGDYPEAVHTALHRSVNELQWSFSAKARLLFVLLDAPPHYEQQIISDIHTEVRNAGEKGIRIIPITASGIDKETEFLMRYMAIATGGTYVFVTDHSGIGNDHLEPTIGQYEVEFLNELLTRLINKYIE